MTEGARPSPADLVVEKRYLAKDGEGKPIETKEGMFRRVAVAVAAAEGNYRKDRVEETGEQFFQAMAALEFLPNSPTLMNAGRTLGQLAACFVLPLDDTLDSIFEGLKETAKIHQTGGGTGFSFSRLRPRDDIVRSTMGSASGPVSFMRVFNAATEVIRQGGARRGANMGVLRIDHPDIEEFVSAKNRGGELTNFNLSVAVTDGFMDAWAKDGEFGLINPRTGRVARTVRARSLLQRIGESAWSSGEPGALFIDTINRANPLPDAGLIEATNPCGEMPLLPYESCCLGSINLAKTVKDGVVDWQRLKELVHLAIRFLDDVIDVNRYPLRAIEDETKKNRKVGLGVMGFAHMLIKMDLSYDSPEALRIGEAVMRCVQDESKIASARLAQERGTFPGYDRSVWKRAGLAQRNATTTAIAPTGTLSLIAGTSSGIEPLFSTRYKRQLLDEGIVEITDPLFEQMEKSRNRDKSVLARLFRTAHEVEYEWHLAMQQVFQRSVDNGVSKTINLPEGATVEMVCAVYRRAYEMGLKGITVFRDSSRANGQALSCSPVSTLAPWLESGG